MKLHRKYIRLGGSVGRRDQCGRREIALLFRPPGFTTNDDRSMHEMSSINAAMTKQLLVNLVLLCCAIRFNVDNKFHFDAEARGSPNCALKIGVGPTMKHKAGSKPCLSTSACANSTRCGIFYYSIAFYITIIFFDLYLLAAALSK